MRENRFSSPCTFDFVKSAVSWNRNCKPQETTKEKENIDVKLESVDNNWDIPDHDESTLMIMELTVRKSTTEKEAAEER